jgi:FkbM family methyltransferase
VSGIAPDEETNTMRWTIKQLADAAKHSFRWSDDFEWVYLPLNPVHADVLVGKQGRRELTLQIRGGCSLVFHTHRWCSAVYLSVNGIERTETLFAEESGFRTVRLPADAAEDQLIVIRAGAPAPEGAQGTEVWLSLVELDVDQSWLPRSIPIGPGCCLTWGECGTFLTLSNDTTIGASITRDGIWARRDVDYFRSVLRPGMVALDIGANIGHHTVLFSSLVGPGGRVVAFEPQRTIYRILTANVAINGCDNADLVQSCVGESEGTVHLYPISYDDHYNFGALGVDPEPEGRGSAKGEPCRVATLDQLLSELPRPLERCDFIKIDVQSFELFALRGGEALLRRFKPTIFLEIAPHWMAKFYDYREIYRYLRDLGYEILHPTDPSVPPGAIKEWSGEPTQEWDVIARPIEGRG